MWCAPSRATIACSISSPKREKKFFEEQSEMMATFIRILGIFITVIFSTGATIGAMITMYGAVANRTTEIGTLRALGFFRRSISAGVLDRVFRFVSCRRIAGTWPRVDAAVLLRSRRSTSAHSRSWRFHFALSPSIVATSLGFSLLMGLIGGFLPAVRAARLDIIQALRAV